MPVWFWKAAARILRFQTIVQAIVGIAVMGLIVLVMALFGDGMKWWLFPLIVAFYSAIGLGVDLQRQPLGSAMLFGSVVSFVLALLTIIVMGGLVRPVGHGLFEVPIAEGLAIFFPLFLVLALLVRWCARREARKVLEKGTSRFDPCERERRRGLIERFKRARGS